MSLQLSYDSNTFANYAHLEYPHKTGDNLQTKLLTEFASAFLKEANLGILLIDAQGRLSDISAYACEMFAVHSKSSIGLPFYQVFSHVPVLVHYYNNENRDNLMRPDLSFSWNHAGQTYQFIAHAKPIYNRYGTCDGTYVAIHNATQLQELEQHVRHNDRLAMIGRVAAGAAHEIRNPLTSLKGFLQMMRHRLESQHMARELQYTEIMLTEIERINELVGEFLYLSKTQAAEMQPVELGIVLEEIMPLIESEAHLNDVSVRWHTSGIPIQVLANREQLKQVILNVGKNGIEAMDNQGCQLTIRERINYHENSIAIEIHDQGAGIPPFMIDKIFDPFFTTKENGTGLGLPICKRIIQDIGGQIRIASKGFGTVVTIVLPIHTE